MLIRWSCHVTIKFWQLSMCLTYFHINDELLESIVSLYKQEKMIEVDDTQTKFFYGLGIQPIMDEFQFSNGYGLDWILYPN